MKKVLSVIFYIVTGLLVFLMALIGFASRWAFTTWGDLDMDEIVFHLQEPLEGAGNGVVGDYLLKGLLPAVLILILYIVLLLILKNGKPRLLCSCAFLVLVVVFGFLIKNMIWQRLDMGNWINGRINQSAFIEEHYADSAKVKMTFPEKKRNLIYIYLESMETTYADEESGGAFTENTIPELTRIARENEDFSGTDPALNGGLVLPGCGFTTGAIFAQSAGLPLKLSIGGNFMDTQSTFFPGVKALGDILQEEGYRQVYLIGSDVVFGGRKLFFEEHGGFGIQQQEFYENTTVILCGDHTTMDTNFCENVPDSYPRRVYTAFIHPAVRPEQPEQKRLYSTMDLFPTTLAALGVRIEGDRLALGTNLFSAEKTLMERYGTDRLKRELSYKSDFLEKLEKVDQSEDLLARYRLIFDGSLETGAYDPETETLDVRVSNIYFYEGLADESMGIDVLKLEVEYQETESDDVQKVILKRDPDEPACFSGKLDLSGWQQSEGEIRANLYTADGNVYREIDSLTFSGSSKPAGEAK